MFNQNRAIIGRILRILGILAMFQAVLTAGVWADPVSLTNFVAYNDLAWFSGQPSGNITTFTTTNGFPAGVPSGGLVDYLTGQTLTAQLTVDGGSGVFASQGLHPAPGTDAYAVFEGKLDATGTISYGTEDLVLTLSALDPAVLYELVLYSDRNNPAYVGVDARNQYATLEGAAGYVNASSPGTTVTTDSTTDDTTVYNAGYNSGNGYVTRFTDIAPGGDGTVVLRLKRDAGNNYYTYANALMLIAGDAEPPAPSVTQWKRWEQALTSTQSYTNPYAEVVLRVTYDGPNGRQLKTYGFWDGGDVFKIRCAFPEPGAWSWHTECSDTANTGLHNQSGTVNVAAYAGTNLLYQRGFLRVSPNGRYLTYGDGTPFFWLGDTGWAGPNKATDSGWQTYVDNRLAKGFTVSQIAIAPTWSGSTDSEGNTPFIGSGVAQWNPVYWQNYEQKVQYANDRGLVLFMVGLMCPTYEFPTFEEAQIFARNVAARFYGNFIMFSPAFDDAIDEFPGLMEGTGRTLRDATKVHLLSNHFGTRPVEENLHNEPWLSFDMFQSGHNSWRGDQQIYYVTSRAREMPLYLRALSPPKPSVNGEAIYELSTSATAQLIRQTAYLTLFSGGAGYTYGASGLWSWSSTWASRMDLPAAYDMGHIRALYDSIDWWRLAPAHGLIENQASAAEDKMVLTATPAGDLAVAYMPDNAEIQVDMTAFRSEVEAKWMSPDTGAYTDITGTIPNTGVHTFTRPGSGDWVLVLTAVDTLTDTAPQVDAGLNKSVSFPRRTTLAGSVSDDLLAGGKLGIRWQQMSGPGTVIFEDPHSVVTEAAFPQDGTYVLRLSADDGAHLVYDEMRVAVDCGHIAFMAYNDLAWADGQPAQDITTLTRGQTGALVDYITGQALGATLAVDTGGSGPVLTQGADPHADTDAGKVFGGIVSCAGVISYSDTDLVMTFSNLDPALAYELVLFANRAGGYTNRFTTATLGSAVSFVNTSSVGAQYAGPGAASATVLSGENTAAGLVVRFGEVRPGSDGVLTLTLSGYEYANALMIKGYDAAGEPQKVGQGAVWRYRKGTAEPAQPPTAWRQLGYDDAGWATGAAPIGYGNAEIVTALDDMQNAYSSVFLRRAFLVMNPALVEELNLWVRYDDGFIVWVNGEEVARVNVAGAEGEFVPYDSFSIENRSSTWSAGLTGADMPVLRAGTNVVAVQVFNRSLSSGDLVIDLDLSVLRSQLSVAQDADQNHMPDDWEAAYLSDLSDPADRTDEADPDNDGMSNLAEWIAGTDPDDETGNLKLETGLSGGQIELRFEALAVSGTGYDGLSRYYALEERAAADLANWTAVAGYDRIQGSGQTVTFLLPGHMAAVPAFHRVKVWLE